MLGVIPARGGSKGIPGKNLALVGGRPLLAYTASAALASRALTHVVVSTDDVVIAEAARTMGLDAPFLRPAMLAADDTPMLPVLQHAVGEMATRGLVADTIVLLQPTSPLRRAGHIDAAVALLDATGADAVVSVVEVPHHFNPVSVMRMDDDRLYTFLDGPTVTRRQDKPRVFARNGPAVLATRARVLAAGSLYGTDTRGLVMTAEDSLDVDAPWDLHVLDALLARQAGER